MTMNAIEKDGSPGASGDVACRSKVHLIGIGGIGLEGLARIYLEQGLDVTGSDASASGALVELEQLGARIERRHAASNLADDVARVVISAAIPEDNPEVLRAKALGIPVEKFASALARCIAEREGVAVAGTHGKTTVSSWITDMLRRSGRDIGYLVGGRPIGYVANGHQGSDPTMVCEACEYDRSFLRLRPQIAVINNIEEDHLDYYDDLGEIVAAFREFAGRIKPGGALVAPTEVLEQLDLPPDASITTLGTGQTAQALVRAEDVDMAGGTYVFTLFLGGRNFGRVRLSVPGLHNVHNALSVAAVGFACGVEPADVVTGLREFRGVGRRLESIGEYRGALVLDDYAHHPTEVAATLQAAREAHPDRRLWAVFQPHQYSRMRRFQERFADSFGAADRVVISEIFRAREEADPELSGAQLAAMICERGGRAEFLSSTGEVMDRLKGEIGAEDVVLTMGAGDITEVAHDLVR